jgi:tetratricopeptide (TPR) repeat protein
MFPHKKLDWLISRLDQQVAETPDDPEAQLELARALLSQAIYHGGGEGSASRALGCARKVLNIEPGRVDALVAAGTALVGMGRPEGARKYLEEASRQEAERADLHLAWGALWRALGDRNAALRHLEGACRLAPDDWETHLYLGRILSELAREVSPNQRLIERGQYHLVQALRIGPSPDVLPPLLRDVGISCLQTGRYQEAERFFLRLREYDRFRAVARFHLGLVAYHLGKYKNAIQHFRQYLSDHPQDPRVHTRMGMAYLQLGEYPKARSCCERALVLRADEVQARYTMGCAHLEEGNAAEANRVFKVLLKDHPEYMPAYLEMARIRRSSRDVGWLVQALTAEAGGYDRLPAATGVHTPRHLTRQRIAVLLEELRSVGASSLPAILRAQRLVQDEGVRFQLWEAACALATHAIADDVASRLREPGTQYGVGLGRQAVAAATTIPEPVLARGLAVEEEDLKRAASERYEPTSDVTRHRYNLARERDRARAYQGLLLIAVASRRSRSGRRLLERWAATADPELAVAAQAGLATYGDPVAIEGLRKRASARGASARVEALLQHVVPPPARKPPRPVSDHEDVHCSTCGRTSADAEHLMVGSDAVICENCVLAVSQRRRDLRAPDDAHCSFCGNTHLETRGLYRFGGVNICSNCLELSLGVVEREAIESFLAAW